jgi:hypothetical protein
MPGPNSSANESLALFAARGFTAEDLAALIGAHTASRQVHTDLERAGTPQDSTPDIWDNLYYKETVSRTAPFSFASDLDLADHSEVGSFFKIFGEDKVEWDNSFSKA